jgi:hypothetical protein
MKIDKRTWQRRTGFLVGILSGVAALGVMGIVNWLTGLTNATALIFIGIISLALAIQPMQVLSAKIGEKLFKHTPGLYDEDNPHNLLK